MSVKQPDFDKIRRNFERCSPAISTCAIAVSGGADSVALMHLAKEWQSALIEENKTSPDIHVLTVNHGLRPESVEEVRWVKRKASELGFKAAILTWDGAKPESGVQEAAREARYALMVNWCRSNGVSVLMTGHHQDDQAETVLMRLARGSGLDGLSGMSSVTMLNEVNILRPLLETPGAELREYLRVRQLEWMEDKSNQNENYERVRVRKALGLLEQLGLSSEDISRSARRLGRARQAVEQTVASVLDSIITYKPEGYALIERPALFEQPEEVSLRCLSAALLNVGNSQRQLSMAKLEALHAVLCSEQFDGDRSLAGCVITGAGNKLCIIREVRGKQLVRLQLEPGGQCLWDSRFRIDVSPKAPEGMYVRFLTEKKYLDLAKAQLLPHKIETAASIKHVRASLPSIWQGENLLYVPHLDVVRNDFDKKLLNVTFAKET